jgi:predicted ATPase with chaperone activity
MLGKRIVSILPPLSSEEALEVTKIHSISGLLPASAALVSIRLFRSPHHSVAPDERGRAESAEESVAGLASHRHAPRAAESLQV